MDRGIDVYTTLNVQHIESLNDVVERITGISVKETVPDLMIEVATSIQLIDLPPEEALSRAMMVKPPKDWKKALAKKKKK